MTDNPAAASAPTEAAERGTLDVRIKALQHIVERIALGVHGSVAHETVLGRLRGNGTPNATVTMEGRSARVHIDVAVTWPCRVAEIAQDVRDTVLREATRLSGVDVRTVDVTVQTLTREDANQPERRVQ